MGGFRARREQAGFTLIELLVVIMIIAILAAIAVPIFLNQREKAYESAIQARLKDASTSAEAWAVENFGTFEALDEEEGSILIDQGFKHPEWAASPGYITIEANDTRYCIQAQHAELSPNNEWRRATYDSMTGRPVKAPDVCPEL